MWTLERNVNVMVKGGKDITFWLNINASLSSKPEDMWSSEIQAMANFGDTIHS